jgi:hypothetical protein
MLNVWAGIAWGGRSIEKNGEEMHMNIEAGTASWSVGNTKYYYRKVGGIQ